ncbi:MAG: lipoprotein insertase outer membrane protein LolB [Stagnimonas sp.]|nr:lipoprotein insertase outer membrane protein LolB [Stagnimonas sp.]
MAAFRAPALALTTLLLAGCLPAPRPGAPEPAGRAVAEAAWDARQEQLRAIDEFQLQGRLAVKGGGLSGALRWRQQGARFKLRLAGPLGAGALLLEGDDALVSIKGADIDLVTAEPEQVLAARTGWLLPLRALRWWVLGLPAPQTEARVQLDPQGRALGLSQLGWELVFSDYRAGEPGLPGRIEARRGPAQATVIVESLHLGPAP